MTNNIVMPGDEGSITPVERRLIHRAFSYGPSALLDAGLSPEEIETFLDRPAVKAEIALLESEYKNRDAIQSLSRFMAQRSLLRSAPDAVDILRRAVAGTLYARDEHGRVLRDENGNPVEMDSSTFRNTLHAAEQVLDRIGVADKTKDGNVDVDINMLFQKIEESKVEVRLNPDYESPEEKGLSREKIRNAIELLRERLPAAKKKLTQELNRLGKIKRGKKKKGKKKKT